jgi:1-acyl-sn-glycerol-3-phosphate acyltransferase
MSAFPVKYRTFIKKVQQSDDYFGFDVRALARIEPILKFLHNDWWRVKAEGFQRLPETGPALIVGNASGIIPWVALILTYILMSDKQHCRRVNIVTDMDWIEDERLNTALTEIGFVPWSATNVKRILSKGELVAIFPEGSGAAAKDLSMKNRVGEFDWTKMLPAIEAGVKVFPLSTLGCDEAPATFFNAESLSKALKLSAFPISPFFPWLPFPLNLISLPISWKMHLLPAIDYQAGKKREDIEECAKKQALFTEGEIQAELNRQLRLRHRLF